jgi:site-specific DNA-cytosine methylase
VACECSGRVREAFRARGHNAWSCDVLPSDDNSPFHYRNDVRDILDRGALGLRWDLLLAFPPCTYLTVAGNRYWHLPGRAELRQAAFDFALLLYNADVDKVCLENPAGYLNKAFRAPDQIVHPYYFGEPHQKRTCLWLRGLRPLVHWRQPSFFGDQTHVDKPGPIYIDHTSGMRRNFTDSISGGSRGQKLRSATFPSIAAAMAENWG